MTRYEQMAGTPEKFAEFLADMLYESISPQRYSQFIDCEAIFKKEQTPKILCWLNEPVEANDEGA